MGLRGPGQVVIQIQIMRFVTPLTGITERNRFHDKLSYRDIMMNVTEGVKV